MIAAVRRLERAYPCHRAQAALQPIAEAYAGRWQRALERSLPLPDVFDLIQAAVADRVPILAAGPLLSYIDRCAQDRRVPEPHRIVLNFVHGYILTRHPFKAKCRCHAPLALPSPQPQPTSPDAAPPPPPPSFPRRREPRRAYAHPQQPARRTVPPPPSSVVPAEAGTSTCPPPSAAARPRRPASALLLALDKEVLWREPSLL